MSLTPYVEPPLQPPLPHDESEDEDERRERHEFNLDEAVERFVDEPYIVHDMLPDGDSEEEDDEAWSEKKKQRERDNMDRGSGNLYLGRFFFNGVAFKEAVLDYALRTGRNLKQYRYDKTKLGYMCAAEGCSWRVYCAQSGSSDRWQIKVLKDDHCCVPNGQCEMVKVPVIARLFIDKIRDEPDYYMPMKIEELMLEKFKIIVSRPQCQAARNKALKWIERDYDEQFQRLRDYRSEILLANSGSTVDIETITNAEGLDVFDRFYVCFDCLKRSWKELCRPLLGVDGCFLRGKMKGQLLVALGRDGNNVIYPVAWGVVQVKNTPNWLWFVNKLKGDLELGNGVGFVMISDRQKGLIRAVELKLPSIEHRMCVRHIYGNLKAKHGRKTDMKQLLWNLAWSYNDTEYAENLDRIFCYDVGVYNDILRANPKKWCRAFYKLGSYCEDVENNSTESFNNSIVKARERPLVPMLETIARLAMVPIAKRNGKANEHTGICTPYVQRYLLVQHDDAGYCQVFRSTNMAFQVNHKGCAYRVSLEKRTCSCRKWDITGIPCVHAYAAIMKMKLQVEDFVSLWFRSSTWQRTYSEGVTPMRGFWFWPTGTDGPIHKPPEPKQPGRNKKDKRKKGVNESPTKLKRKVLKRIMHCKICKGAGHNARTHNKRTQSSQAEPSQGILTQASQGEPSHMVT